MSDFSRYYVRYGNEYVEEDEAGEYMLYADHRAIVLDLNRQIWKLKDDLEAARMEAGGYA